MTTPDPTTDPRQGLAHRVRLAIHALLPDRSRSDDYRLGWEEALTAAIESAHSVVVQTEDAPSANPTTALRDQLLHALDFAYCQGLGYDTPEALLTDYDAAALENEREASRRLLAQRQEMAEERYAWQERGDRAEAEVKRHAKATKYWFDAAAERREEIERLRADRAAVLREAADEIGRMDYDTDSHDYGYDTYRDAWDGGVMDAVDRLRRMAAETPAAETDTLPAWLHWRFGPHGQPWAEVPDEDKSLWEYQARAVRRAVARGGFKQPAAGARQGGAPATTTDTHACDNCDGIDPGSCLANPDRPDASETEA